jgi:hypothetical protein
LMDFSLKWVPPPLLLTYYFLSARMEYDFATVFGLTGTDAGPEFALVDIEDLLFPGQGLHPPGETRRRHPAAQAGPCRCPLQPGERLSEPGACRGGGSALPGSLEAETGLCRSTQQPGLRSAVAQFGTGNASGVGGFFFQTRFGISDAALVANARSAVGLTATTTAFANADPSTFLNFIGMAHDAADTNWQIMRNTGSGTATKIDLTLNYSSDNIYHRWSNYSKIK